MIKFYTVTCHYNASYGRYPITVILTNSDPKKFLLFQKKLSHHPAYRLGPKFRWWYSSPVSCFQSSPNSEAFRRFPPSDPRAKLNVGAAGEIHDWIKSWWMGLRMTMAYGILEEKTILSGTLVSFWPIFEPVLMGELGCTHKNPSMPKKIFEHPMLRHDLQRLKCQGTIPGVFEPNRLLLEDHSPRKPLTSRHLGEMRWGTPENVKTQNMVKEWHHKNLANWNKNWKDHKCLVTGTHLST